MDPHHHGPHVMEVSKGKRYFLFATACTHVLLASGEAYGWTALRPVLQDSGLFDAFDPDQQSTLMNAVATMGIAGNALCKLPLGMILDKCGPRFTSLVGCLLLIAGSIILALCDKNDTVLPVLGYFLLGIAGPFIQMPCFQFSELFGTRKASAMAYLITCFELSTGVFWVFGELHREWNIQRRELFLGYSGVGLYCLVTGLFFWPDLPFRAQPPPQTHHHSNGGRKAPPPPPAHHTQPHALMDKPLHVQIFSAPFLYVTIFLSMHIFRQGFLLATLGPQVEYFFQDPQVSSRLKNLFNIILPLGFVPMMFCTASGFAGYILNRPRLAFIVVTLLSQVYGLFLLWHDQMAFITLFVVFPVARQFVFSTFFSFSANTFGYASFGRIAGVASTVAGLLQLTQTQLVKYVEDPATPLDWQKLDLMLGVAPVILFIYPIGSWIHQCCADTSKKADIDGPIFIDEDDSEVAPLMGDGPVRPSSRPMLLPTAEDDEIGAPVPMHYSEASSYGSQSASSFAALYSKYVTDDVKVMVRPITPTDDSSIHVSSFHGASSYHSDH